MMDRLEKSSGQTVITLNEAKSLLKQDDDLIVAVYDYWLNKRLKMVGSIESDNILISILIQNCFYLFSSIL